MAADETNEEDEEVQLALAASMASMKDPSRLTSKEKDVTTTDKKEEMCSAKKPEYPPLPEEPKGDRNLLCRVGVRLPDGRRIQRNFLRTDPIQVKIFHARLCIILALCILLPTSTFWLYVDVELPPKWACDIGSSIFPINHMDVPHGGIVGF